MQNTFVNTVFKGSDLKKSTLDHRLPYLNSLGLTKENYQKRLANLDEVDSDLKNANTRLAHMFHIISFLRLVEPDSDLTAAWVDRADALRKKRIVSDKLNISKESEADLLELQRVLNEKGDQLLKDLPDNTLRKKRSLEALRALKQYYRILGKHLLLSLYINMPAVRNDFAYLHIATSKGALNDQDNFIVVTGRTVYMVLNHYKTAGRYGSVKLDVGPINAALIRGLLKVRKVLGWESPYLFAHQGSDGLTPIKGTNSLGKHIRVTSEEYFDKPYTINTYRHAWETHIQHSPEYANMTIAEREALHVKLLHSIGTALYYNRQPASA